MSGERSLCWLCVYTYIHLVKLSSRRLYVCHIFSNLPFIIKYFKNYFRSYTTSWIKTYIDMFYRTTIEQKKNIDLLQNVAPAVFKQHIWPFYLHTVLSWHIKCPVHWTFDHFLKDIIKSPKLISCVFINSKRLKFM